LIFSKLRPVHVLLGHLVIPIMFNTKSGGHVEIKRFTLIFSKLRPVHVLLGHLVIPIMFNTKSGGHVEIRRFTLMRIRSLTWQH